MFWFEQVLSADVIVLGLLPLEMWIRQCTFVFSQSVHHQLGWVDAIAILHMVGRLAHMYTAFIVVLEISAIESDHYVDYSPILSSEQWYMGTLWSSPRKKLGAIWAKVKYCGRLVLWSIVDSKQLMMCCCINVLVCVSVAYKLGSMDGT